MYELLDHRFSDCVPSDVAAFAAMPASKVVLYGDQAEGGFEFGLKGFSGDEGDVIAGTARDFDRIPGGEIFDPDGKSRAEGDGSICGHENGLAKMEQKVNIFVLV